MKTPQTPQSVVWIFEIDEIGTTMYTYLERFGGIRIFVAEQIIGDADDISQENPQALLEWYMHMTRMDTYAMGECTKTIAWLHKKMFGVNARNSKFTNVDIEKELAKNGEGFWPDDK